jgi:hypothetical protein
MPTSVHLHVHQTAYIKQQQASQASAPFFVTATGAHLKVVQLLLQLPLPEALQRHVCTLQSVYCIAGSDAAFGRSAGHISQRQNAL